MSSGSNPEYIIELGACEVHVWPKRHYLETVFVADGAKVPAMPHDTDEYRATAERLGYGKDTWAECREHETLHTWLAQKLGHAYSPTLWHVAHNLKPEKGLIYNEEVYVMSFQKYLQTGERDDEGLKALTDARLNIDELALDAVLMLAAFDRMGREAE